MKFLSSFLLFFMLSIALVAQDTIPNPGFENWTFFGLYNDPNEWGTLNYLTVAVSKFTITKDSLPAEVHSGRYSVKIKSVQATQNQVAPGILTTGIITQADGPTGGRPFTSRPAYLTGWYMAAPVHGDTASLAINIYKTDTAGNKTTVGSGEQLVTDTVATWTPFSVPIHYNSQATPDTVEVIFFSSTGGHMQTGSTLWIDDLAYSDSPLSGIEEPKVLSLSVYPNPASHQVTLDNSMHATTAILYSIDGKLSKTFRLTEGTNTLDVSNIAKGNYVLTTAGSAQGIYRTTLVIE